MARIFFILGGLFAFLGVAAGAFGAHTLRDAISTHYLNIFETGVRYQMYHSFGLFISGWALDRYNDTYFRFAGWMFVAGILLFSGSLYALVLTGSEWLGAITPLGGVSFLAGWLLIIIGFWCTSKKNK
jgi:uncharacterized membrane protein YgdD (TMEM256/DUF423 family)